MFDLPIRHERYAAQIVTEILHWFQQTNKPTFAQQWVSNRFDSMNNDKITHSKNVAKPLLPKINQCRPQKSVEYVFGYGFWSVWICLPRKCVLKSKSKCRKYHRKSFNKLVDVRIHQHDFNEMPNSEFSNGHGTVYDMQDCKQSISFQCANAAKFSHNRFVLVVFSLTRSDWIVCKCDVKREIKAKQIVMQRAPMKTYRETLLLKGKKHFNVNEHGK